MLFIAYYEVYPEKLSELVKLNREVLMKEELPKGVKVIADCLTPGHWGVTVFEADSEDAVFKFWAPVLKFFRIVNISPALRVEDLYSRVNPEEYQRDLH